MMNLKWIWNQSEMNLDLMDLMQIPPSATGKLIGPGGRQINEIQELQYHTISSSKQLLFRLKRIETADIVWPCSVCLTGEEWSKDWLGQGLGEVLFETLYWWVSVSGHNSPIQILMLLWLLCACVLLWHVRVAAAFGEQWKVVSSAPVGLSRSIAIQTCCVDLWTNPFGLQRGNFRQPERFFTCMFYNSLLHRGELDVSGPWPLHRSDDGDSWCTGLWLCFLCLTLFPLHFVSLCVRVTVVAFHVHAAAGCALRLSQLHK